MIKLKNWKYDLKKSADSLLVVSYLDIQLHQVYLIKNISPIIFDWLAWALYEISGYQG